jgi:hypothetical protein
MKRRVRSDAGAMWAVVLTVLFALPEIIFAAGRPVPTYTKDVAPILSKHCVKCHQTGEIASNVPLLCDIGSAAPLVSYAAVQSRAQLIKQEVVTREMPPWPADPTRSLKFRNDPRLSQKDIDTIVAWVNGGAPKGNDADLRSWPKFEDGWTHPQGRKPDLIISLPADMQLPAKGVIPYMRVWVKVPFSNDQWVVASQTRPSNAAVVHHMALTEIALPDGITPQVVEHFGLTSTAFESPAVTTPSIPKLSDMLSIYTPGSSLEIYKEGSGKLLRGGKNMYVVFNIHYQTTGKPETDRSRIGLWFTPVPPEHQLFRVNGAGESILANGRELLSDDPGTKAEGTHVAIPPIPPFAEKYELIGVTGYPDPVTIYQFQPHAHYRGKDFTYSVVYPDGREQTLLSVPKYDHRWQVAYELETPLKLPAGSKLVVTAHYDNSTKNLHNPAPEKAVYFRDQNQSWDEMFTPFVQYSIDRLDAAKLSTAEHGGQQANPSEQPREGETALEIGEVVGCLEANPAGNWLLTHASEPRLSETQATSSMAVKAAYATPLGSYRYHLLGAGVFNPASYQRKKVVVKGILIKSLNDIRINVTSLQMAATHCVD